MCSLNLNSGILRENVIVFYFLHENEGSTLEDKHRIPHIAILAGVDQTEPLEGRGKLLNNSITRPLFLHGLK